MTTAQVLVTGIGILTILWIQYYFFLADRGGGSRPPHRNEESNGSAHQTTPVEFTPEKPGPRQRSEG